MTANDPRVYLAAERTLLAWIRTGLAMMGLGFAVARLGPFLGDLQASHAGPPVRSPDGTLWFGTALVLMGVVANLMAGLQHVLLVHRLRNGTLSLDHASRSGVAIAVALALVGIAVLTHLLLVR